MRRLEEMYNEKKKEMKKRLNRSKSKYSITCDVWTSKNQLSFFGLHMEAYYTQNYANSGFSVLWNQVECMAHVLNLGAQQILKEFKQPVDKDTYEAGSDTSDNMVTAVSRLSFLCRKIRLAPKLRRLMQKRKKCTVLGTHY